MKNIGIIGYGWLGSRLANHLKAENKIFATTTSEAKTSEMTSLGIQTTRIHFSDHQDFENDEKWQILKDLDVIIITVPFSTRSNLSAVLQRYKNVSDFINGYKNQLFLMSSTGIYPQTEMDIWEQTFPETSLDPNLLQTENLIKTHFPQVNILRLGGLMGNDRIFSNYNIQLTDQIVNHVHFEDICLIIESMIHKQCVSKTYNVVAPLHPTKVEIFNYQKGISGSTGSKNGVPGRKVLTTLLLEELNYEYKHPDPKLF